LVREPIAKKINRVAQAAANPIQEFLRLQSASGILLFFFTLAAIVWSNSPWSHSYKEWWHTTFSFGFGTFVFSKSLLHWINDGLMSVFFFVVGLEIKREILIGELSSLRKAMLPVVAAVGGMAVPALIYALFTRGTPALSGWGIPMATDIAFSLGVLALLGKRVPIQLKIFLTAFAIVDDIGAVIVIAFFYASSIVWGHLAIVGVVLILLVCANWLGVRHLLLYTVLGVILWLVLLDSGIHATVAGVLLAMTIPARSNLNKRGLLKKVHLILEQLEGDNPRPVTSDSEERDQSNVRDIGQVNENFKSPLQRFEYALHPWVIFGIMPLFAFANAGVTFEQGLGSMMLNSVPLGVFLGLVLGKQIGITLFSWIAVKSRIASLPSSVTWRDIYGVAWLGGIGFTMSLFIAGLAFGDGPLMGESKVGIYAASFVAGIGGLLILSRRAGPLAKDLP
jgi:Na+:H+ antiporter, NhaA family